MLERKGKQSIPDPEAILKLKDSIFEAWTLLPTQHRATIVMTLAIEVLKGEWGEWLKEAVSLWRKGEIDSFPFTAEFPMRPVKLPSRLKPKEDIPDNFDEWMKKVDEAVWQMVGCSVYDLPDYDFRSMFEDGDSPTSAADQTLIDAGFSRFE